MKLKTLPEKLRIACDLDDTIFDWIGPFSKKYPRLDWNNPVQISSKVFKTRKDKKFWENLPVLEFPDFEPTIYSTKRINSKIYTKNNLKKHGLPIKPIYQTYFQNDNKARIIKGHCDVLIDDSAVNVYKAINSGLPALLITRPHNEHIKNIPRINSLTEKEIMEAYCKFYT